MRLFRGLSLSAALLLAACAQTPVLPVTAPPVAPSGGASPVTPPSPQTPPPASSSPGYNPVALSRRLDALPGWKRELVEITDPDVLAKSGMRFHPLIVPGGACDEVTGMVFEITEDELASADRYEVSDYKRVAARRKSGTEAGVYVTA